MGSWEHDHPDRFRLGFKRKDNGLVHYRRTNVVRFSDAEQTALEKVRANKGYEVRANKFLGDIHDLVLLAKGIAASAFSKGNKKKL